MKELTFSSEGFYFCAESLTVAPISSCASKLVLLYHLGNISMDNSASDITYDVELQITTTFAHPIVFHKDKVL